MSYDPVRGERGQVNRTVRMDGNKSSLKVGRTLRQMATVLITVFLDAKMRDVKTSAALYSVSSDVDEGKIAEQMEIQI
jgi:hypothetical protein